MASSQQLSGLARSSLSGRVFARFKFDDAQLNSLVSNLNYASTQGAISSVVQLKDIGAQVLGELKKNFPGDEDESKSGLNLKAGWRVQFYDAGASPEGASLLGFAINHRQEQSERIRTILASLEGGSKPYTIGVGFSKMKKKALFYAGARHPFAKADIPARAGHFYMEKTEAFAAQLLASRGSQMEQMLVDLIEKGTRYKERLTADSVEKSPPGALSGAVRAYPELFAAPPRALIKTSRLLRQRLALRAKRRS